MSKKLSSQTRNKYKIAYVGLNLVVHPSLRAVGKWLIDHQLQQISYQRQKMHHIKMKLGGDVELDRILHNITGIHESNKFRDDDYPSNGAGPNDASDVGPYGGDGTGAYLAGDRRRLRDVFETSPCCDPLGTMGYRNPEDVCSTKCQLDTSCYGMCVPQKEALRYGENAGDPNRRPYLVPETKHLEYRIGSQSRKRSTDKEGFNKTRYSDMCFPEHRRSKEICDLIDYIGLVGREIEVKAVEVMRACEIWNSWAEENMYRGQHTCNEKTECNDTYDQWRQHATSGRRQRYKKQYVQSWLNYMVSKGHSNIYCEEENRMVCPHAHSRSIPYIDNRGNYVGYCDPMHYDASQSQTCRCTATTSSLLSVLKVKNSILKSDEFESALKHGGIFLCAGSNKHNVAYNMLGGRRDHFTNVSSLSLNINGICNAPLRRYDTDLILPNFLVNVPLPKVIVFEFGEIQMKAVMFVIREDIETISTLPTTVSASQGVADGGYNLCDYESRQTSNVMNQENQGGKYERPYLSHGLGSRADASTGLLPRMPFHEIHRHNSHDIDTCENTPLVSCSKLRSNPIMRSEPSTILQPSHYNTVAGRMGGRRMGYRAELYMSHEMFGDVDYEHYMYGDPSVGFVNMQLDGE